nr:putative integron gene cassette protein [uncultured bacterium]
MSYIIERTATKLVLGIVGIPITLLAILGAIDSVGLLLGGIEKANPWAISFGLGTFTSYFGITGAWMRISNKYESLSKGKVRFIRRLLGIGVVGAVLLTVGALGIFGLSLGVGSVVFMVFGAVGVFFIKQTPSQP